MDAALPSNVKGSPAATLLPCLRKQKRLCILLHTRGHYTRWSDTRPMHPARTSLQTHKVHKVSVGQTSGHNRHKEQNNNIRKGEGAVRQAIADSGTDTCSRDGVRGAGLDEETLGSTGNNSPTSGLFLPPARTNTPLSSLNSTTRCREKSKPIIPHENHVSLIYYR